MSDVSFLPRLCQFSQKTRLGFRLHHQLVSVCWFNHRAVVVFIGYSIYIDNVVLAPSREFCPTCCCSFCCLLSSTSNLLTFTTPRRGCDCNLHPFDAAEEVETRDADPQAPGPW